MSYFLCWFHRCTNATVVITIWFWPLLKIHISNDNGSFTFYVLFSFFYHGQYFYWTGLYKWVTRCASYKLQEMLTLGEHLFFWEVVLLIFLDCCILFLALLFSSFCVLCTHCCLFLWIFHLVFANVCFVLLFVLLFI